MYKVNLFRMYAIGLVVFLAFPAKAQQIDNLAHTFSIVARDAETGEMGVAVQTHFFAVGGVVPWAEAGVGAVATQSFANASFGSSGLALLKQGLSPKEALDRLLASDDGRDTRQVAIIGSDGRTAAWTGADCIAEAGHIRGENFSVQANMMLKSTVWAAMKKAFLNTKGPLAERMLAALDAAQTESGDIRGMQAAALIVVQGDPLVEGYTGPPAKINIRVDDHEKPLTELRRLYNYQMAMNSNWGAVAAVRNGDLTLGSELYAEGQNALPGNLEFKFWYAIALANKGELDASLPIFKDIFTEDPNWRTLTERMPEAKLLNVDEATLERILAQ
jgi:uncharacterized Ntn-hydrolase superfamily protein